MCGRGAIERRFEMRREPVVGRIVWMRHTRRRHLTRAELVQHLLPDRRVRFGMIDIRLIEQQAGRAQPCVVTGDAILVESAAMNRRRWRLCAGGHDPESSRREQSREGEPSEKLHYDPLAYVSVALVDGPGCSVPR